MADWDSPDVGLLHDLNGLAQHTPEWTDRAVAFLGEQGLVAVVAVLVLWAGWSARRRTEAEGAAAAVAGVLWAPSAAGIAWLINIPIRAFVARPRPATTHDGVEELLTGKTGFSFVSDHTTVAMAVGVALFMVSRRLGLLGIAVALVQGLCRVYLGVHYPTDVVGGLALGTAVALLLAPGGLVVLTPLMRWMAGTRARRAVRSRRTAEDREDPGAEQSRSPRPSPQSDPQPDPRPGPRTGPETGRGTGGVAAGSARDPHVAA